MCRGLLKSFRFLKGASMTKYDIIIPIGSVCKTSQNLRDLKKQNESLPFDWIFVADLDMIYTALETHFADFLKLENMEYKCKESEQTDIYFDRATGIGFWHDFPHNVPIEKSFDAIKKKYNRRIERLFNEIGQAKDILFLRVCTIRPKSDYSIENIIYHKTVTSDEVVEEQFQRLKALYPDKNVDMLEVSLFNEPHPYLERRLNSNLVRIEAYSPIKYEWQGDPAVFKKILRPYDLKYGVKFKYLLKTIRFKAHKFVVNIGAKLGIAKYQEEKKRLKKHF